MSNDLPERQERDLRLLAYIGIYLFGDRWQAPMADALELNPRTVRGWVQGRSQVQEDSWRKLAKLVEKKAERSPRVLERMNSKIERLAEAA